MTRNIANIMHEKELYGVTETLYVTIETRDVRTATIFSDIISVSHIAGMMYD